MSDSRRRRRRPAGFTLVEVLLVLVILVIIASLGITNYARSHRKALISAAKINAEALTKALQEYQQDVSDFPSTGQGLQALLAPPAELPNPDKWKGPYLSKSLPLDPWDQPFQYEYPGRHNAELPDVWSMGPDKTNGTDDDVGNWQ